jgi:hypothetical protein
MRTGAPGMGWVRRIDVASMPLRKEENTSIITEITGCAYGSYVPGVFLEIMITV